MHRPNKAQRQSPPQWGLPSPSLLRYDLFILTHLRKEMTHDLLVARQALAHGTDQPT